jgi:tRNA dimethylallyltransferase
MLGASRARYPPEAAHAGMQAMSTPSPPFPVIYGPTASGKSALAMGLALALAERGRDAVLIAADAFQVYRGMDIGTAKPTAEERRRVRHELVDVADPHAPTPFTVDRWLELARAAIDAARARGAMPIVVGGTSLYVQALLYGLFEGPPADPSFRAAMARLDPAERRARLERLDPQAARRIHAADARRTIRALEVLHLTGRTISSLQRQWALDARPRPDARLILLRWPVEELNRRINARVRQMARDGLVDEVRRLLAIGPLNAQAREALGYKQIAAAIQHADAEALPAPRAQALIDDALERTKIETRRFAKNQRTWFKRLAATAGAVILDGPSATPLQIMSLLDGAQPVSPAEIRSEGSGHDRQ